MKFKSSTRNKLSPNALDRCNIEIAGTIERES